MRKTIIAVLFAVAALCVATFTVAGVSAGSVKAGDTVYVCGCGEACQCKVISETTGKCACGKDLAKATVVKVDGDAATVSVNGREQAFPLDAKGCGNCDKKPAGCASCDKKPAGCASCDKKADCGCNKQADCGCNKNGECGCSKKPSK